MTQVAKYLEITKGNVGYYMKVLAEAGFVRVVDGRVGKTAVTRYTRSR